MISVGLDHKMFPELRGKLMFVWGIVRSPNAIRSPALCRAVRQITAAGLIKNSVYTILEIYEFDVHAGFVQICLAAYPDFTSHLSANMESLLTWALGAGGVSNA